MFYPLSLCMLLYLLNLWYLCKVACTKKETSCIAFAALKDLDWLQLQGFRLGSDC